MTAIGRNRGEAVVGRPGKSGRGRGPIRNRERKRAAWRGAVEALEPRVVMATFSVTSAADAGPGSLRDAIDEANRTPREAHVIEIDPAVAGPIVLASALPTIVGEVEIAAPEDSGRVTILRDPDPETPEFRILTVGPDALVTLRGLTLSGGQAEFGGGILNEGKLDLFGSEVSGNVAGAKGGGIYNTGQLALLISTVRDNVAEGVRTIGFGPAGIGRGGGVYNTNSLYVASSTLSGNRANREGGAIYNELITAISTSTLADNSAEGFMMAPGRVPIGRGGAIYSTYLVTVDSSTIAGNRASRDGGGIFSNVARPRLPASYIRSSIVAGNAIDDVTVIHGEFESQGSSLVGSAPRLAPGPGDLIGVDPMLAPLGDYGGQTMVMPLLPGSPAIAAGLYDEGQMISQRGHLREPGKTDIGADQSRPFSFSIVSGDNQAAGVGQPFAEPLVVLLSLIDPLPTEGATVTFRVPGEGPSALISPDPQRIDAQGRAQVLAIANEIPGTYTVVAETVGADPVATFTLTNLAPAASPVSSASVPEPRPAASASAGVGVATPAGRTALGDRQAIPRPSAFGPAWRQRIAAGAEGIRQSASGVAEAEAAQARQAMRLALARGLDQARARNGSSSRPGTPISTT